MSDKDCSAEFEVRATKLISCWATFDARARARARSSANGRYLLLFKHDWAPTIFSFAKLAVAFNPFCVSASENNLVIIFV